MLTLRTDQTAVGRVARIAPVAGTAAVVSLAISHTGVDTVTGSVSALIPTLEARFDLTGSQVSMLLATLSTSSMLSQPLIGSIADRIGAKKVAVAGAVTAAALLSLLGVVGHIAMVFALMVVGGLGSAGYHPAAAAVARRVMPERTSLAVSLFSAGGMLGFALGPIAVLLLAANLGLGFTPLLMIPGVATALVLWRVLPPDERRASAPPTIRQSLGLLRGPVGTIALAVMLVSIAGATFHIGLPLWLTDRGGYEPDAAMIGWTLAAFDLAAALGGLAASGLANRFSPARVGGLALAGAPFALLGLFAATPGTPVFFVAAFAAGALLNAASPLLMVAAQDRSDGAVAAASGLVGFATGVAGLVFVAIGVIIDSFGLGVGLAAGFLTLLPAAAIALRALSPAPSSCSLTESLAACACGTCACPAM